MEQRKNWYFLLIGCFFSALVSCGVPADESEDIIETTWLELSELASQFETNRDKVASRLEGRFEDGVTEYKVQFYANATQRALAFTALTREDFVALGNSLNSFGLQLTYFSEVTSAPSEQINAIWNIVPEITTLRSYLNPPCYGSATEGYQLLTVTDVSAC